jgi:hypothetical protein
MLPLLFQPVGYTFGTILASSIPLGPPNVEAKCDYVGSVKLFKNTNFIVCCDDEKEDVYFFPFSKSKSSVGACLFSARVTLEKKRRIFSEMREWYRGVYGEDLEKEEGMGKVDSSAWGE